MTTATPAPPRDPHVRMAPEIWARPRLIARPSPAHVTPVIRTLPMSATLAANEAMAARLHRGQPVLPLAFGEAGLPVQRGPGPASAAALRSGDPARHCVRRPARQPHAPAGHRPDLRQQRRPARGSTRGGRPAEACTGRWGPCPSHGDSRGSHRLSRAAAKARKSAASHPAHAGLASCGPCADLWPGETGWPRRAGLRNVDAGSGSKGRGGSGGLRERTLGRWPSSLRCPSLACCGSFGRRPG
jgi:hypothetical protein